MSAARDIHDFHDSPEPGEEHPYMYDGETRKEAIERVFADPTQDDAPAEGEDWTDEDEAELRDYQDRVSGAGTWDQYEPTRQDHSRLAELKERKETSDGDS